MPARRGRWASTTDYRGPECGSRAGRVQDFDAGFWPDKVPQVFRKASAKGRSAQNPPPKTRKTHPAQRVSGRSLKKKEIVMLTKQFLCAWEIKGANADNATKSNRGYLRGLASPFGNVDHQND